MIPPFRFARRPLWTLRPCTGARVLVISSLLLLVTPLIVASRPWWSIR